MGWLVLADSTSDCGSDRAGFESRTNPKNKFLNNIINVYICILINIKLYVNLYNKVFFNTTKKS